MENKLQQLTEKLYNEGLSKGRAEAEAMITKAKEDAEKILSEARNKAQNIADDAKRDAEQLRTNTENEVRLASGQLQSALRQQIETMVHMQIVTPQVSKAWSDNSFIKDLALTAVAQMDAKQGLSVVLPENKVEKLLAHVKSAFAEKIGADGGVEVVTDARVRVPFRIAVNNGGYYINFADADFDALFKSYLRPKVSALLFGGNKDNQ